MISKLWFRFGIPLGSATVLAALLDLGLSSYWFLNYFGSFIYLHILQDESIDARTIFGVAIISLRCILTLSLWGFIFLSTRGILLVWLPTSIFADLLFIILGVYNHTHDNISDEIWFLNLAAVVILRFYITIVIIQTFRRLLQNAKVEAAKAATKKNQHGPESGCGSRDVLRTDEMELQNMQTPSKSQGDTNVSVNVNGSNSDTNKFDIVQVDNTDLACPQIDVNSNSPRFLLLDPIGESVFKIWEFYSDTPRLGAAMLVIFELIWNVFTLSTHALTEFLLGGLMFFMIKEEEVLMRIWRIILNLVALIFIFKRRKTLLRFWLIGYFWTLFASLCIFVYVIADWLYPPPIQVIIIVIIFFGDNCIRFGIVYFVLRTTVQPPAVTPTNDLSPGSHHGKSSGGVRKSSVNRSHSLKSQTAPRIKRKNLANKSTRNKYGSTRIYRLTDPTVEID